VLAVVVALAAVFEPLAARAAPPPAPPSVTAVATVSTILRVKLFNSCSFPVGPGAAVDIPYNPCAPVDDKVARMVINRAVGFGRGRES
jgi:hypothetical protein